jgi:hypothetical protein
MCKWPNCEQATKCTTCGRKLCHLHDGVVAFVEGHFSVDNVCHCIQCWEAKREPTRCTDRSNQGV